MRLRELSECVSLSRRRNNLGVQRGVFSPSHQAQVAQVVVLAVAIFMVNALATPNAAPDTELHHSDVLTYVAALPGVGVVGRVGANVSVAVYDEATAPSRVLFSGEAGAAAWPYRNPPKSAVAKKRRGVDSISPADHPGPSLTRGVSRKRCF